MDIFDKVFKIATIVIASTNIVFAYYVFKIKNKKDDVDKEKDRRLSWMKNLILDHTLKNFYYFFEDLNSKLAVLKMEVIDDEGKSIINDELADKFVILRHQFINPLSAVNEKIYDDILVKIDFFQDYLTEEIFNSDNDFTNSVTYNDIILNSMSELKGIVLRILFVYRGD